MKATLKIAMKRAVDWMMIGLVMDLIFLPLELLFHRQPFNGLLGMWWQSDNKLVLTGILVLGIVAGWLLLTLIFWLIAFLMATIARHDQFPE